MLRSIAAAALLVAAVAFPASAQLRPTLDVGAGIAGGSGTGAGVVGQVAFEFGATRIPVSLRVDASHHRWSDGFLTGLGSYRASAATVNLVLRAPSGRVRPYVLGGVGSYALEGEGVRPGVNVGGGIEVPVGRYRLFGEIRGHFVNSQLEQRLTPLVVGLRF